MKKLSRNSNVVIFVVALFVFYLVLIPLQSLVDQTDFKHYQLNLLQFTPLIGVLLVSIINRDFTWIKSKKSDLTTIKIGLYLVVPNIILVIVACLVSLILTKLNQVYVQFNNSPTKIFIIFLITFICCAGEEIGWRKFLYNHFRERNSVFLSSLFVGIIWSVWHLRLDVVLFIVYFFYITSMSVIISFLFEKSKSLFVIIFFHSIWNMSAYLFFWERFTVQLFLLLMSFSIIIALAILLINRKTIFKKEV